MREQALILGRFNLPHSGHIALIERALKENRRVTVALSISNSNKNAAPWTLRVQALHALLYGDYQPRVSYTTWTNISQLYGFDTCPVYLGADRTDLAQSLLRANIVDEARIIGRVGEQSSTNIRDLLDNNTYPMGASQQYIEIIRKIRKIEKENGYGQ